MQEDVFKAALAGLLHDIGKFAQRAGLKGKHAKVGQTVVCSNQFDFLFPIGWLDDIGDAVGNHHGGDTHKEIVKAVRVADWLASSERSKGHPEEGSPGTTPLLPITMEVSLDKDGGDTNWALPLTPLSVSREDAGVAERPFQYPPLFPRQDVTVSSSDYEALWTDFVKEIQDLPGPVNSCSRMVGLMSHLRKYTSCIPSATPWEDEEADRTVPDVSLYDHLKLTAAIAPCLLRIMPDTLDSLHEIGWQMVTEDTQSVARLLRADFSGIQNFIYRITTPERERTYRHTAKRLRGRSFYISLLCEVVADWLLRQLGLTAANSLFVGGGRFDLLIPIDRTTSKRVDELQSKLQNWLFEEFNGVLGLEIATQDLAPLDFGNLSRANAALDDQLSELKRQKLRYAFSETFFSGHELEQVCEVCGLTPMAREPAAEAHICPLCKVHHRIGTQLPKTAYVAHLYGPGREKAVKGLEAKAIDFGEPIGISVALLAPGDIRSLLELAGETGIETIIYSLNDSPLPATDYPAGAAPARMYMANAAPVVDNEVYEFDEIAKLSAGSNLLGVLKADVDNLGLIFGLGLKLPTISRVAALSRTFDQFFLGYLNTLCYDVTEKWKKDLQQRGEEPADVESLFYIVYAGGDDLLIIGPWDQTVELAKQMDDDFRAYVCHNPNITLSAGIVLVKPHFPVQQFVNLVNETLEKSKNAGRDRITVFNESVPWVEHTGSTDFDALLALAHDLRNKVKAKEMPRTLVHDMGRLRGYTVRDREGGSKPLITPQLLYLLSRRLPRKIRDALKKPIFEAWDKIRIPVSFVSLSTRKE